MSMQMETHTRSQMKLAILKMSFPKFEWPDSTARLASGFLDQTRKIPPSLHPRPIRLTAGRSSVIVRSTGGIDAGRRAHLVADLALLIIFTSTLLHSARILSKLRAWRRSLNQIKKRDKPCWMRMIRQTSDLRSCQTTTLLLHKAINASQAMAVLGRNEPAPTTIMTTTTTINPKTRTMVMAMAVMDTLTAISTCVVSFCTSWVTLWAISV